MRRLCVVRRRSAARILCAVIHVKTHWYKNLRALLKLIRRMQGSQKLFGAEAIIVSEGRKLALFFSGCSWRKVRGLREFVSFAWHIEVFDARTRPNLVDCPLGLFRHVRITKKGGLAECQSQKSS